MNILTIVNQNGQLLVESRQVAEMTNVRHSDLLEKINGYINHLTNGEFRSLDFFIESTYQDGKGETRPCYLITKKGCDMVANKMTGEKGVLFTATYVTRFEEMEKQLSKPLPQMSQMEIIAAIAQGAAEHEKQLKQIAATQTKQAEELQGMRDVISLDSTSWRTDSKNLLIKIARKSGNVNLMSDLYKDVYKLLDARMGTKLQVRLVNLRKNMALEGASKTKQANTNILDVIALDKKMIEGFVAIVKEMAIKAGIA